MMDDVTLLAPISRKGEPPIKTVNLRKPSVGDLRGLTLTDLLRMDVKTMERLLPRITNPSLLPDEVMALDPADLLSLAGAVVGFFVTPAQAAALEQDRPH